MTLSDAFSFTRLKLIKMQSDMTGRYILSRETIELRSLLL